MAETLNMKNIEKKTYDFYNQDGLIDLVIGTMIFCIILCFLAEMIWLAGAFIIFIFPMFTAGKQKITVPRIGQVKFGVKGQHRLLSILLMIIGNVVLIFFLGLFIFRENIPSWIVDGLNSYPSLLIGVIGTFLLLISAVISGIKRFYFYAVCFFTIFFISQIFAINLLISASVMATIIIPTGGISLGYFIRKYPVSSKGEEKDAKY